MENYERIIFSGKTMEWIQTINNAINYIEQNLTQNITVQDVSSYSNVSIFHFQRTFNALTCFTVSEYIRNRRLSLAGEELTKRDAKVIDVAYKYGYETPESFTKAFQRFHGITPVQAKKGRTSLKSFQPLSIKVELNGGTFLDYRILDREAFDLCILSRVFDDSSSAHEIPSFWTEYLKKELHEIVPASIGLCSQIKSNSNTFQYGIGCEKAKLTDCPPNFEVFTIPATTWAIFPCTGAMPDAIQNMWKRIYKEWLPQASYEMVNDFDFEYYTPGNMQSKDYVSEIWIPVKEKRK